jgi:hypothetical protein
MSLKSLFLEKKRKKLQTLVREWKISVGKPRMEAEIKAIESKLEAELKKQSAQAQFKLQEK